VACTAYSKLFLRLVPSPRALFVSSSMKTTRLPSLSYSFTAGLEFGDMSFLAVAFQFMFLYGSPVLYSLSSLKLVVGTPIFTLDSAGMGIFVNIFCCLMRLAVRLLGFTISSVCSGKMPFCVGFSLRGCLVSQFRLLSW